MKQINGINYLRIGEVAKIIDRTVITIKNWYAWAESQSAAIQAANPLPEICILDVRGTRYFAETDIPMLIEFRDNIVPGSLSDFNVTLWGQRGKSILERGTGKTKQLQAETK